MSNVNVHSLNILLLSHTWMICRLNVSHIILICNFYLSSNVFFCFVLFPYLALHKMMEGDGERCVPSAYIDRDVSSFFWMHATRIELYQGFFFIFFVILYLFNFLIVLTNFCSLFFCLDSDKCGVNFPQKSVVLIDITKSITIHNVKRDKPF